ncbi:hypothetical protein DL98DRAFT_594475 [Cadophora sp. DSE1049]|nr:hypothetical protein DL98DRAFT_594475 [Cadophora sp. DSE1049]
MDRSRPIQSSYNQDSAMYGDQPYADEYRGSSSQGYQTWKDDSRTPPRGSGPDRAFNSASNERHYREDRVDSYDRGYDRSRSPRGRARYTDRDREGYQSPRRERSRSRSPYFGAPPNRNVILEGLPFDWTQEDVGRPISTLLRILNSNPLSP